MLFHRRGGRGADRNTSMELMDSDRFCRVPNAAQKSPRRSQRGHPELGRDGGQPYFFEDRVWDVEIGMNMLHIIMFIQRLD